MNVFVRFRLKAYAACVKSCKGKVTNIEALFRGNNHSSERPVVRRTLFCHGCPFRAANAGDVIPS